MPMLEGFPGKASAGKADGRPSEGQTKAGAKRSMKGRRRRLAVGDANTKAASHGQAGLQAICDGEDRKADDLPNVGTPLTAVRPGAGDDECLDVQPEPPADDKTTQNIGELLRQSGQQTQAEDPVTATVPTKAASGQDDHDAAGTRTRRKKKVLKRKVKAMNTEPTGPAARRTKITRKRKALCAEEEAGYNARREADDRAAGPPEPHDPDDSKAPGAGSHNPHDPDNRKAPVASPRKTHDPDEPKAPAPDLPEGYAVPPDVVNMVLAATRSGDVPAEERKKLYAAMKRRDDLMPPGVLARWSADGTSNKKNSCS